MVLSRPKGEVGDLEIIKVTLNVRRRLHSCKRGVGVETSNTIKSNANSIVRRLVQLYVDDYALEKRGGGRNLEDHQVKRQRLRIFHIRRALRVQGLGFRVQGLGCRDWG